MSKEKYKKENMIKLVAESFSLAEVIKKLGNKPSGGTYRHTRHYINLYNLDTSHFTGKGHLKGKTHNWTPKIPLEEIMVQNSTYTNTTKLKLRLLKAELLTYECLFCKITTWQDKPITLHMDHINGVHNDNRLENLRLLCPNCHSQTPTYGNKKRS